MSTTPRNTTTTTGINDTNWTVDSSLIPTIGSQFETQDIFSHIETETTQSSVATTPEVTYEELNPLDYYNSSFPSLMNKLGVQNRNNAQLTTTKRTPAYGQPQRKPTIHKRKDNESTKRKRNEDTWLRMEAVAKQKMAHYERYASEMTYKLNKQRQQINQRSKQLLDHLSRQEIQKKEEKIFDSSYGRIWRHHRTMQRRAFNLEPMSAQQTSMHTSTSTMQSTA